MIIVNGKPYEESEVTCAMRMYEEKVAEGTIVPEQIMNAPEYVGSVCVSTDKAPDGYLVAYTNGKDEYHSILVDLLPSLDAESATAIVTVENPEKSVRVDGPDGDTSIRLHVYGNTNEDEVTETIDIPFDTGKQRSNNE